MIVIILVLLIRQIACHLIDKLFRNRLTMTLSKNDAVALEEKRLHTLSKLFKSIVSYVLMFGCLVFFMNFMMRRMGGGVMGVGKSTAKMRSEEHTSELQSH